MPPKSKPGSVDTRNDLADDVGIQVPLSGKSTRSATTRAAEESGEQPTFEVYEKPSRKRATSGNLAPDPPLSMQRETLPAKSPRAVSFVSATEPSQHSSSRDDSRETSLEVTYPELSNEPASPSARALHSKTSAPRLPRQAMASQVNPWSKTMSKTLDSDDEPPRLKTKHIQEETMEMDRLFADDLSAQELAADIEGLLSLRDTSYFMRLINEVRRNRDEKGMKPTLSKGDTDQAFALFEAASRTHDQARIEELVNFLTAKGIQMSIRPGNIPISKASADAPSASNSAQGEVVYSSLDHESRYDQSYTIQGYALYEKQQRLIMGVYKTKTKTWLLLAEKEQSKMVNGRSVKYTAMLLVPEASCNPTAIRDYQKLREEEAQIYEPKDRGNSAQLKEENYTVGPVAVAPGDFQESARKPTRLIRMRLETTGHKWFTFSEVASALSMNKALELFNTVCSGAGAHYWVEEKKKKKKEKGAHPGIGESIINRLAPRVLRSVRAAKGPQTITPEPEEERLEVDPRDTQIREMKQQMEVMMEALRKLST